MLKPDLFYRISAFGGMWAILGFPVSVSLSQAGLSVAVIGWILYFASLRRGVDAPLLPFRTDAVLLAAAGIYAAELFSLLAHAALSGSPGHTLAEGLTGELKDAWILSAAFWIRSYASTEEGRRKTERLFLIAGILLVATGLVSIFSPYRLSRIPYHLMHGWEASAEARHQHLMGTLFTGTPFEFGLYMPVGLMNTHLTYGALLSLFLPFVIFRGIHLPISEPRSLRKMGVWSALLLIVPVGIVFVLNNARSIMLGGTVSVLIALYYFTRVHWKRRAIVPGLIFLTAAALLIGALTFRAAQKDDSEVAARLEMTPFQEKHTDFQRIYLWESVVQLIRENPLIGVGPGGFQSAIDRRVLENAQLHPGSWVEYMIIQRGHSHNDPLHLTAIAGLSATALYYLFFFLLIRRILIQSRDMNVEFLKWGPLSLLIGGLFQCYFQDDEVLLPFWLLVGYLLSRLGEERKFSSEAGEGRN